MNNFTTRAISGGVFIATLIFASVLSKHLNALLFLFFTVVGTFEYLQIIHKNKNIQINALFAYGLSTISYGTIVSVYYYNIPSSILVVLIPIVFFVFITELFRLKKNAFTNILHTILPSLYIALPFALFIVSNELSISTTYNAHFTLCFFYCLWANDTGAYLSGRAFGKTKLFPKISPNKTWEGTIGGAILAISTAFICSIYFTEYSSKVWMTIGFLIVVFGSLGDLVESMLKRNFQVKDSGKIMPGHGGILDRFDGLLLAAPMVYSFLILMDFFL